MYLVFQAILHTYHLILFVNFRRGGDTSPLTCSDIPMCWLFSIFADAVNVINKNINHLLFFFFFGLLHYEFLKYRKQKSKKVILCFLPVTVLPFLLWLIIFNLSVTFCELPTCQNMFIWPTLKCVG